MPRKLDDPRFKPINDWLVRHRCEVLHTAASDLSLYQRIIFPPTGCQFIVEYKFDSLGQAMGWEVYVPTTTENRTTAALAGLEKAVFDPQVTTSADIRAEQVRQAAQALYAAVTGFLCAWDEGNLDLAMDNLKRAAQKAGG